MGRVQALVKQANGARPAFLGAKPEEKAHPYATINLNHGAREFLERIEAHYLQKTGRAVKRGPLMLFLLEQECKRLGC